MHNVSGRGVLIYPLTNIKGTKMKDSSGISVSAIRHLLSRARFESGYHLDLVGAEVKVNRSFDPIETDYSYRERINKKLIELYKELKAEPAAKLTGSNPQYTVFDEAHHADGFAGIKDRLDKLGEKVDQASASLKSIIQTHFRPEQEVSDPQTMGARLTWERAKLYNPATPPEGTSHMDYFREQFMTAPIKTGSTVQANIRAKCFDEHFHFDPSNLQDVTRVTSECLQAQRADDQMSRIVARSKHRQAAQVYVHQLFSGIGIDALKERVDRDFGPNATTASDEEYSIILASVYNMIMKRAQDKAGSDE